MTRRPNPNPPQIQESQVQQRPRHCAGAALRASNINRREAGISTPVQKQTTSTQPLKLIRYYVAPISRPAHTVAGGKSAPLQPGPGPTPLNLLNTDKFLQAAEQLKTEGDGGSNPRAKPTNPRPFCVKNVQKSTQICINHADRVRIYTDESPQNVRMPQDVPSQKNTSPQFARFNGYRISAFVGL